MLQEAGPCGRLRRVLIAAGAIVCAAAASAPFLWVFGALDEIEWHDDFITGVLLAVVIYASTAVGFVMARPHALLVVWAAALLWILIEELRWEGSTTGSGLDDMSPVAAVPFSWIMMAFPAIGLWLADRLERT